MNVGKITCLIVCSYRFLQNHSECGVDDYDYRVLRYLFCKNMIDMGNITSIIVILWVYSQIHGGTGEIGFA